MLCLFMRRSLLFLARSLALMVQAFRPIGLLGMLGRPMVGVRERATWQAGEQHQGEQTSEPPEEKIHSEVPPANPP